jgi:hypothetical protein
VYSGKAGVGFKRERYEEVIASAVRFLGFFLSVLRGVSGCRCCFFKLNREVEEDLDEEELKWEDIMG